MARGIEPRYTRIVAQTYSELSLLELRELKDMKEKWLVDHENATGAFRSLVAKAENESRIINEIIVKRTGANNELEIATH